MDFLYFLVSWAANSTLQDTAKHGYHKLFAYHRATVSRSCFGNNKLLTISEPLTWCQALCFFAPICKSGGGQTKEACCHVIFHVPKTKRASLCTRHFFLFTSFPTTICISFLSIKQMRIKKIHCFYLLLS